MNDPSRRTELPADLCGASAELARGSVSSRELTDSCLDAIALRDGLLCSFTHVDAESALAQAAASDIRRTRGQSLGPLDGIPIAIKANIAVADWPLTAGMRWRAAMLASGDAFVVKRLRDAGAVLLGLTNMDEGALGAEGANPWFGTVHNPHRRDFSAGGSSAGSGAALAAGFCFGALGTDTIGSLRIPASLCGVAALKPSFGLVSMGDVVPVHLRFDHVGPMARHVADLALLLPAIAGFDPHCRVSTRIDLAPPRGLDAGLRIGFLTGLEQFQITAAVLDAYNDAIARLRERGVALNHLDASRWDIARLRRAVLTLCEREMWRTHGERSTREPEQYSDSLRAFIRYGGRLGAEELAAAEARIARFYTEWMTAMTPFEAVLLPCTASAAFAHGDRPPHNTADLTTLASAAGLPALAWPARVAAGSLPIGLQLIGRTGSDLDLIQIAADLSA